MYVPAVVTALAMPLTFSIATGIGLGFIAYVAIKLACGRAAETRPATGPLARSWPRCRGGRRCG
jgi:adenine/guanine/hypoxanthine permease